MIDRFKNRIRNWIKKIVNPLLVTQAQQADLDAKSTYSTKIAQKSLFLQYQAQIRSGVVPSIDDTGYRIYSQFDEDGIFVFLFAVIGAYNKTFIDIGAGDGINSNCANLAINFGWHGLFIDGNPVSIQHGRDFYQAHPDTTLFPPKFIHAMVTRANINQLITDSGFSGEVDLLSIDIDGNDYWIWDALTCIKPRVVCIETHIEFGQRNIVVPYDENYVYPGVHPDYHGASPVAMVKLARRKGYRLVGSNMYGFNTIYVRSDLVPDLIPEVGVEHILRHPRNSERFKLFEAVKEMPYVKGK